MLSTITSVPAKEQKNNQINFLILEAIVSAIREDQEKFMGKFPELQESLYLLLYPKVQSKDEMVDALHEFFANPDAIFRLFQTFDLGKALLMYFEKAIFYKTKKMNGGWYVSPR